MFVWAFEIFLTYDTGSPDLNPLEIFLRREIRDQELSERITTAANKLVFKSIKLILNSFVERIINFIIFYLVFYQVFIIFFLRNLPILFHYVCN